MSVKIYGGNYLSGMPTLDYRIVINGVGISLNNEDLTELLASLSEKIKKDYDAAKKEKESYDEQVKIVYELKKDLLRIFYDGDVNDIDSFFFKKDKDKIESKELDSFLEKYKRFMGLE